MRSKQSIYKPTPCRSVVGEEAYIARTLSGHIVVFCRCVDEVRIYDSQNMCQKEMSITHDKWQECKQSYGDRSDVNLYNDTINAAWQRLGLADTIDRKQAKLLRNKLVHYFPRIWRGVYDISSYYYYNGIDPRKTYGTVYIGANVAASSIYDALESLFKYVEPSNDNLSVFGHKIREALILACTEVESAWRSVLEANSSKRKSSYTTQDYFSLADPLRLKEWSVALRDYPDLGRFSPFYSWDGANPTKTLAWYYAYNAVKHHREEKFKLANFGNLINSVAALHITQSAQFGPEMYHRFFGNEKSPFLTVEHPLHDLSDVYVPNFLEENEITPDLYFR